MRTMRRAMNSGSSPPSEHAGEIVERGVGIGAAHRLVQRADEIVVAFMGLVVDRRTTLHDVGERRRVEVVIRSRSAPNFLGQGQDGAAVAIGHAQHRVARVGIERQRLALDRFNRVPAGFRAPLCRAHERSGHAPATTEPR